MLHATCRWIYHQSPMLTGVSATIVAGADTGEHPVISFLRALLIPLTVAAIRFTVVNTYPRIKAVVVAWNEAREKRRLASLAGQLAALQLSLASALASVDVKDELIAQLYIQISEERKATQDRLAELMREVQQANQQLKTNYDAIQENK